MTCEFLVDLPSKGLLKHVQAGSAFTVPPPVYVAVHSTSPPHGQVVTTDQSSLLIRCLQSKKKNKSDRGGSRKGKRQAEEQPDGRSSKRVQEQSGPHVRTVYSKESLERMTVRELQSILHDKRKPVSGRRADLIERILSAQ